MAISKVVFGGDTLMDLTSDNINAGVLLEGYTAHTAAGNSIEGSMPNNGATGGSINGLTTTSLDIPAGYTTGGTIELTDDIARALAEI